MRPHQSTPEHRSTTVNQVLDKSPRRTDRIAALAEKGQSAQHQTASDFDWDRPAGIPVWLPNRVAASAISQFYHGEIATARMCRQIFSDLASHDAEKFVETQIDDELRHADIYDRYLAKLGGVREPARHISQAYHRALTWTGAPQAQILAFHVVLEGEAVRLQHSVDMWMPCAFFREISGVIARDEARHVAFGKIYLRESLPALALQERLAIYRWVRDIWFDAARSAVGRYAPPAFLGGARWRRWLERKWLERLSDLAAAGLFVPQERRIFENA